MLTLDRWRDFHAAPKIITFPHLELTGRDHAPPVVVGSGEVRMTTFTDFTFELTGTPTDPRYALSELNRHHLNRYDGTSRLRLTGTDSDGVTWSGGWTVPRLDVRGGRWIFAGELDSLSTIDQSDTVAREPGTELILPLRIDDPMTIAMARFVRSKQSNGRFTREYVADALGTGIRFVFESEASTLLVTALHTSELPATYAENWLSEPLRILFGQLIFPRLVARNLGDGSALVWVRPSPELIREAHWAALLGSDSSVSEDSAFWSLYTRLLTMIAQARDKDGAPNFEAHKVTRLYEEIIQASRGSRWVWTLTFAVAVEALVKMIPYQDVESSNGETSNVTRLIKHIDSAPGDARMKQTAIRALRPRQASTRDRIRSLCTLGVVTTEQADAWNKIRNAVAHGSLALPYSNETDDTRLLSLVSMMHALTHELIKGAPTR